MNDCQPGPGVGAGKNKVVGTYFFYYNLAYQPFFEQIRTMHDKYPRNELKHHPLLTILGSVSKG